MLKKCLTGVQMGSKSVVVVPSHGSRSTSFISSQLVAVVVMVDVVRLVVRRGDKLPSLYRAAENGYHNAHHNSRFGEVVVTLRLSTPLNPAHLKLDGRHGSRGTVFRRVFRWGDNLPCPYREILGMAIIPATSGPRARTVCLPSR